MTTTQDFAAMSQSHIEKSIRFSNIALSGVERMFSLQLDITRDLLADNTSTVKAFTEVKDVQGWVALQQQMVQPVIDKAMAVAKTAYEAASSTQAEMGQFVEEQVVDFNKSLVASLDKVVKQAPAGSEIIVSAVKTAVATAASAYDTVAKTAKKVTADFAEAGVVAAETSAKAAAGVAKTAGRKAAAA
jgi:phasin family protein